jgi:hypothetical protein
MNGRPIGARLLDETRATLTRFVVFPSPEAADTCALFAAATHAQHRLQVAPRLSIKSPVKRCGKTRLLTVMRLLVRNPLSTASISAAALVRSISEDDPPTIIMDETDTTFGAALKNDEKAEHLRGILNAGFERDWPYTRWDVTTRRKEDCPTFAMAVLAGIGDLPETISDRAIVVTLARRAPGERVARYRTRRDKAPVTALGRRLAKWAEPLAQEIADAEPEMPDGLSDRAEDVWEPLIAVADAAGGDWPGRARAAAKVLAAEADDSAADESLAMRLLADLRTVFKDVPDGKLPTAAVLGGLLGLEESPWNGLGRPPKPLDAAGLARRLRAFGVRPGVVRIGEKTARGYARQDLEDKWARYLPGGGERNGRNGVTPQVSEPGEVTCYALDVTPENAQASDQDRYAVTPVTGGLAQAGPGNSPDEDPDPEDDGLPF